MAASPPNSAPAAVVVADARYVREWLRQTGAPENIQALMDRVLTAALAIDGVYVVALDPHITGPENVAWCFTDEFDADAVVAALVAANGSGTAWHTFELVALSLNDDGLREYLAARGVTRRALDRVATC